MTTRALGCLLVGVATVACAGANRAPATPDVDPDAVVAGLLASADAWNRGDLDGFLDPYLESTNTTFAGSGGINRGFDDVRDAYQRSYWRDGPPEDSLAFRIIEVRPLDDDAALVLGQFMLTPPGSSRPSSEGIFSLVFVRTADGWKITHDHSSETSSR